MKIISRSIINALIAENPTSDTHFVRLILHDVSNSGSYRLSGRLKDYVFERDQIVGRHILDIPISIWQGGAASAHTQAAWRDNKSIAEDVRRTPARLSIYILPYAEYDPSAAPSPMQLQKEAFMSGLTHLFTACGVPPVIQDFCDLYENSEPVETMEGFISQHPIGGEWVEGQDAGKAEAEQPENEAEPTSEDSAEETPSEESPTPKKRGRKPRETQSPD